MKRATVFSIMGTLAISFIALATPSSMAIDGPRANATVSFGQWQTDPPLDRFPVSSDRFRNEHQVLPNEVKIKAGGAINFIIGGFHQVIVYGDGTQPGDIDATLTTPSTGTPAGVPLINDATNRTYRGLDPSRQSSLTGGPTIQDRVEVVHFPTPGTYLVICGVQGHFVNDGMFGFVRVREND